jgi:elongation factor Ts
MEITAKMVNDLRQKTGAGLMDCKKALLETNGDFEEATTLLKKKGLASAAKKAGRDASEGVIESYIHLGGKVGVLIEVNCETDFVAKNDEFRGLARDLAMQVAALSPLYVGREDVPSELVEKEREIAAAQCADKPPHAAEKIIEGKLDKWYAQMCLMEQEFIKNQSQKIQEFIAEKIAKTGENIVVRRFVRFQLGE